MVCYILFLCFSLFGYEALEEWKVVKDAKNIKVSTRLTNLSKVKEFKAECTINAPIKEIFNILNEVDAFPLWMANVKSAKTLKKISETNRYDYYEADIPWPIKPRDTAMTFVWSISEDKKKYTATVTATPDYIPEKKGIIRIVLTIGEWQLTKIDDTTTAVRYQMLANPGGELPEWLINAFIVNGPFETLQNLKNRVKPK